MSAMRYCGSLRVRVTYVEDWTKGPAEYRCHIRAPEGSPITVYVGPPVFETHARDDSEAFDSVAHAALGFASNEGYPVDAYAEMTDAGWAITRKR